MMQKHRVLVTFMLLVFTGVAALQSQMPAGIDPQRLWGLVVGVSNYAHAQPLQYAASDAQSFSDFLKSPRGGSIPSDHIITLIEDQATRTQVLMALDSIQEKVKPGDNIYLYFAGHGYLRQRSGYFIPSDGDLRSAPASAVPFAQLKDMIESGLAHARTRVLITDICHAGRVGTNPTPLAEKIQNLINEEFFQLRGGGGTFLNLLASRPSEASYERDDFGEGVFTHTLLEALNGKAAKPGDATANARDVVDYVRNEVPKYTAGRQHPLANEDYDPSLPLSFLNRPGPAPSVAAAGTVLELVNAGKTAYVRVQWTDPKTDSVAVRQLPRSQDAFLIGSLAPGDLQLRFFDEGNRAHPINIKLSPGRNTVDLGNAPIGGRNIRRRLPGDIASLSPTIPSAPKAGYPLQTGSPANDRETAALLMRLERSTRVYFDGADFGSSERSDKYLQLVGLAPGIHKVALVSQAEREQRFRVRLFAGKQVLDPPTGELRFVSDVVPPAGSFTAVPESVPPALREIYRDFSLALWEERLIEPSINPAWDMYQRGRDRFPPAVRDELKKSLAASMGNRAQRIILKYLRGGDIRWNASIFEEGTLLMERMRLLFKSTPMFLAQQSFFSGRALIERGQYSQAVQELQRSISLDPEAGHAYNAIGLAYWKQNLFEKAIPALQQAMALSPLWTYPRVTLGLIYLEQRRYQETEQAFRTALQIDPEDSSAHHGLAQLHFLLGRPAEAEQQVQNAIEFAPGNAYAYETLGRIRQTQQRYPEAEAAYRLAIRMEPDEPSFQSSLADLLRQVGRLEEAQQVFARVLDRNSDNLQVQQAYVRFLLEQKRNSEAETFFSQAIKRSPANANLRVLYGNFLRGQDRDKEAERQLKAALQIEPENAFAHHDLALVYLSRKQVAAAENELALASKADPRFAPPHKLLGEIRSAQKRFREAVQEYHKALELSIDAHQRETLKEASGRAELELARQEIEGAGKMESEGKYTDAWETYCSALKTLPDSRELRNAVLRFHSTHPSNSDFALLPPGGVAEALKTGFWQSQQNAEDQWRRGRKAEGIRAFAAAVEDIDMSERRILASASFNLENEEQGLHAVLHRWALRMIEARDYRGALRLMESAVRQKIFAPIPSFEPVTIESLILRPEVPDPKSLADFDILHHADRRPHEVYAAALAGTGDMDGAKKYLTAIETGQPDLRARMLMAKTMQAEQRLEASISLLKASLEMPGAARELMAEAFLLLAEIRCQGGDCAAAAETLREGLRRLPGNKSIDAALKKLKF